MKREERNKTQKLTIDYQFNYLALINKSNFGVITVLTLEWIVIMPVHISGTLNINNQRYSGGGRCGFDFE